MTGAVLYFCRSRNRSNLPLTSELIERVPFNHFERFEASQPICSANDRSEGALGASSRC